MKKIIYLLILITQLITCKYPKVVDQEGKKYRIIDWDGGAFVYVTYLWDGGKFEDAIEIIEKFVEIAKERNLGETAIGRFPDSKTWELGMIIKEDFDEEFVMDMRTEKQLINQGKYASMLGKGHPENIFVYWKKLKTWLVKDGHIINSPVFEIYDKAFSEEIDIKKQIGEIRYMIE